MGLSSTQVPGDQQGLSWTETLKQSSTLDLPKPPPTRRNQERQQQQQQQQSERLECPRCGSTNTKFCYYNNYNKLQPRYFCKGCKRHWTKGGILRNVPVGGGRKNKRVKPSSATTSTTTSTTSSVSISNGSSHSKAHIFGPSQQSSCQALDAVSDQVRLFGAIRHSSTSQQDAIDRFSGKNPLRNECTFTFSTLSSQENQNVQFSFASHVSALDNIPSSTTTSYPHKDGYGCCTKNQDTSLDSTITTTMPTTSSIFSQPWQDPTASGAMDVPNYWNWNDIDTFISADLDTTWDDDTEIKF